MPRLHLERAEPGVAENGDGKGRSAVRRPYSVGRNVSAALPPRRK